MKENTENRIINRYFIALMTGLTCISFAPILVRSSEIDPTATAFWRMALSIPLFLSLLTLEQRKANNIKPDLPLSRWWLIVPGIFFAGDLALWHWSIYYTTVANATLLANFASILVTFGSWLWLGERFNWVFVVGAITAFAGTSVLVGADLGHSEHFFGNLLGLATAVFYSAYLLSIKKLRQHFSTTEVMTASGVSASLILLAVTVFLGEPLLATTWTGWLWLFLLAFIAHFGGQGLVAYALLRLPAGSSAVSLLLQPMLSTCWAWLFFAESLTELEMLAAFAVLMGIFLAQRGSLQ